MAGSQLPPAGSERSCHQSPEWPVSVSVALEPRMLEAASCGVVKVTVANRSALWQVLAV